MPARIPGPSYLGLISRVGSGLVVRQLPVVIQARGILPP